MAFQATTEVQKPPASASKMVSGGLDGSSSSDSTAAAAAGGGTKTVTGVEAAAVGGMTAAQPTKDMCCLPASLRSVTIVYKLTKLRKLTG